MVKLVLWYISLLKDAEPIDNVKWELTVLLSHFAFEQTEDRRLWKTFPGSQEVAARVLIHEAWFQHSFFFSPLNHYTKNLLESLEWYKTNMIKIRKHLAFYMGTLLLKPVLAQVQSPYLWETMGYAINTRKVRVLLWHWLGDDLGHLNARNPIFLHQ